MELFVTDPSAYFLLLFFAEAKSPDDEFPPLHASPVLSHIPSPVQTRSSTSNSSRSTNRAVPTNIAVDAYRPASPSPLVHSTPARPAEVQISIQGATPQTATPATKSQEWWEAPDDAQSRLGTDWQPSPSRRASFDRATKSLLSESTPEGDKDVAPRPSAAIESVVDAPLVPPGLTRITTPTIPSTPSKTPKKGKMPREPPTPANSVPIAPATSPTNDHVTPVLTPATPSAVSVATGPSRSTGTPERSRSAIFLPLASDRELKVEPSRSTKAKLKKAEKEKAKLEKERLRLEQVKAELELEQERLKQANLEKSRLEKEIQAQPVRERENQEREKKEQKEKAVQDKVRELEAAAAIAAAATAATTSSNGSGSPKLNTKPTTNAPPSKSALRAAVKAGMAAAFGPSSLSRAGSPTTTSVRGSTRIDIPLGAFPPLGLSRTSTAASTSTSSPSSTTKSTPSKGKSVLPTATFVMEQAPVLGKMAKKTKPASVKKTLKKEIVKSAAVSQFYPQVEQHDQASAQRESQPQLSSTYPRTSSTTSAPPSAPPGLSLPSAPASNTDGGAQSDWGSVSTSSSAASSAPSSPKQDFFVPRPHVESEEEYDPYSLPAMLDAIAQIMDCSTLAFFEPLPEDYSPLTTSPLPSLLDAQTLSLALSALSAVHPTITMEQAVSSFHQLLTQLTDKITGVLGVLPRDREIEGGVARRFGEMFGDVGSRMISDGFDEFDDDGEPADESEGGDADHPQDRAAAMDEVERLKGALIRRAGYLAQQLSKLEGLHTEINHVRPWFLAMVDNSICLPSLLTFDLVALGFSFFSLLGRFFSAFYVSWLADRARFLPAQQQACRFGLVVRPRNQLDCSQRCTSFCSLPSHRGTSCHDARVLFYPSRWWRPNGLFYRNARRPSHCSTRERVGEDEG